MKLGYTEEEIFRMTPRKFFRIYREFMEMNGMEGKQKRKTCTIDDLP